jgi:hypothetical protein
VIGDPVLSPDVRNAIVEAGTLAPSGDNLQPWIVKWRQDALRVSVDPARDRSLYNYRRRASLIAVGAMVENMVIAAGEHGLAALLCEPARLRGAGRVFALGDLFDVEPDDLLRLGGRARELACAQILAPEELVPDAGPVEWVDAEGAGRMDVAVDARVRALYEERLSRRLERWRGACARHRVPYRCFTSATPFERVVLALLVS